MPRVSKTAEAFKWLADQVLSVFKETEHLQEWGLLDSLVTMATPKEHHLQLEVLWISNNAVDLWASMAQRLPLQTQDCKDSEQSGDDDRKEFFRFATTKTK